MLLNSRRLSTLDWVSVVPSNTENAAATVPVVSSNQVAAPVSANLVSPVAATEAVNVKDDEFYPYKAEALYSCKFAVISARMSF
jgi:hypothetical protein